MQKLIDNLAGQQVGRLVSFGFGSQDSPFDFALGPSWAIFDSSLRDEWAR
jgi:hypothetical protein